MSRKFQRNTNAFADAVKSSGTDALFGMSRDFPQIIEIDLNGIDPNPAQPRQHFDQEELKGLADSIERHGLAQPILVKKSESGRYQVIAGERRLRAHQMLGRLTIYAVLSNGRAVQF
jgi:ParB family chromosome partitioning protein